MDYKKLNLCLSMIINLALTYQAHAKTGCEVVADHDKEVRNLTEYSGFERFRSDLELLRSKDPVVKQRRTSEVNGVKVESTRLIRDPQKSRLMLEECLKFLKSETDDNKEHIQDHIIAVTTWVERNASNGPLKELLKAQNFSVEDLVLLVVVHDLGKVHKGLPGDLKDLLCGAFSDNFFNREIFSHEFGSMRVIA